MGSRLSRIRRISGSLAVCLLGGSLLLAVPALAEPDSLPVIQEEEAAAVQTKQYAERKDLFLKVEMLTGIPWYRLAAVDQYERVLGVAQKRKPRPGSLTSIHYTEAEWAGPLNPDPNDRNLRSIAVFQGKGRDGSGDGLADRTNDLDVLMATAQFLLRYGTADEDWNIGVWEYYQNSRSVERIEQFAKLYETFGKLDLGMHAFPLPLKSTYSYKGTWGASRGWGGHRIHEGTDLFAGYGVPARSTVYGVIEEKGWNPYGGWRIGIRDLNGIYYYYAHLSGFDKRQKVGDVVKPGQTLGWVGSSGYGKPGTSGKFPPHLHFGMYRDYGMADWPFDPYPHLRKWEREERGRAK
ncbi:L-Ala--D-Glu endopeptidase [Paenibacillus sp. J31TS4]|uniref:M23 family metallopeptidase n=1 Tax=Paenibacillus sp. J31TS4 TaxID=2807195 RepID=UPI001B126BBD|nr:M23 family metallopeptidase [Paenibacillus sp. J31TS4]GIP40809.1 L-Ala--D-Glu endopeptidase [Paenibacillus sp. J31TS4]